MGRLGKITVQALPDVSGSVVPGEVTLVVQKAFVDSLSRDIQVLENSLALSNHSSTSRDDIVRKVREMLGVQQDRADDLTDLVQSGIPVRDILGNVILDTDSLAASDQVYISLFAEFTTANFNSAPPNDNSTFRSARSTSIDDFRGCADELVEGFKESIWEGGATASRSVSVSQRQYPRA